MAIWIRSQDRTSLIECKKIDICERQDKYEFIANYKYYDGDETYDDLGEYSTKEKAIKVLDMIQAFIIREKGNMLHTIYQEGNGDAEKYMIFEMPQDDKALDNLIKISCSKKVSCTECDLKNSYNSLVKGYINTLQESIDKATPKPPYYVYADEPLCPYCHGALYEPEERCDVCDQCIDWSDE